MIYIFAFPGFFKLGYASCPHRRRAMGFWHNSHPPGLCGRLGECTLTHLFEGTEDLERALHALLLPDHGEFYVEERLPGVLAMLALTLEPLPLPSEAHLAPQSQPLASMLRPCCGGDHGGFQRDDHARRSYATRGEKAPCGVCGRVVSIRHDKLKQHQRTKACRESARVDGA